MLLYLLAALQQPVIVAQNYPPIARIGEDPYLARDIRALCVDESGASPAAMLHREEMAGRAASSAGKSADAWLELGCSRALLQVAGVRSREGFEMPAGESWVTASLAALRQALKFRPGDGRAADVVGLLAMDENQPDHLAALATALETAVRAGASGAPALRACAALAMRVHDAAAARDCANAGLAAGHDSTEHLLTLARLRFQAADTAGGWSLFLQSAAAISDSLARNDLTWHLQWLLWPAERQSWDSVPAAGRSAWIANILMSRDVRDAQPAGARLAEHFSRLEHADSEFRLRVPRVTANELRDGMAAHDTGTFSVDFTADPDRMYARWQTDFDDRGVVWMRFGKPLQRASHLDTDGVQGLPDGTIRKMDDGEREAWSYLLDGVPLVLTFDVEASSGSVAPSRLIPGYIGTVDCLGADQWRCILDLAPDSVKRGHALQLYTQDREYIAAATTTDDNSVRTAHQIRTAARLHRLWDPVTGESIALVTYAFRAADLATEHVAGATTSDVTIALRRWNGQLGGMRDTTFAQQFAIPSGSRKRINLTGFSILPSSPGIAGWSLVATQPGDRRGRDFDVTAPPAAADPALQLSDLVLGQAGQGLRWSTPSGKVLLDPLNALNHLQPVSLYFQVKSATARRDLHLNVSMYDNAGGRRGTKPLIQVTTTLALHAGLNEINRTVDLHRPGAGRFLLEVRLLDDSGAVLARRVVQAGVN
ncbi:MAG TPA: hypothetical protein VGM77_08140 [Gemmatimonadales bacterium]|jgi:hypothetical protein